MGSAVRTTRGHLPLRGGRTVRDCDREHAGPPRADGSHRDWRGSNEAWAREGAQPLLRAHLVARAHVGSWHKAGGFCGASCASAPLGKAEVSRGPAPAAASVLPARSADCRAPEQPACCFRKVGARVGPSQSCLCCVPTTRSWRPQTAEPDFLFRCYSDPVLPRSLRWPLVTRMLGLGQYGAGQHQKLTHRNLPRDQRKPRAPLSRRVRISLQSALRFDIDLASASVRTAPMPYSLLKLAEDHA
jgi:hypothetical protein